MERKFDAQVIKILHEEGEKEGKFGHNAIQITVYNHRYCKLEKKNTSQYEDRDGNSRVSHKIKGFSLKDFELLLQNQDEIKRIMGQYEKSFQDKMFKD